MLGNAHAEENGAHRPHPAGQPCVAISPDFFGYFLGQKVTLSVRIRRTMNEFFFVPRKVTHYRIVRQNSAMQHQKDYFVFADQFKMLDQLRITKHIKQLR